MKLMTVLGTRPEIIRLSRVIPRLDAYADHVLVHTGQNYDARLSDVFFEEMSVRAPDVSLEVSRAGAAAQIGSLFAQMGPIFERERPDRLLILGDTNSGLVAILARRLGIPVFHMEAGNRCFDDRVPEEVNRRVIDHSSTVLLPYTQNSKANLIAEGIAPERILVTGNPIAECLTHYAPEISSSKVLDRLELTPRSYALATLHRAENVDRPTRLASLLDGFRRVHNELGIEVVCGVHPRTRARLEEGGLQVPEGLRLVESFGFFDFVKLEQDAALVLSDSGTVQEECAILRTPNVTIRDVTERPETMETGSNALSGADPAQMVALARLVTASEATWTPPPEYVVPNVAEIVTRILLSHRLPDRAEQDWQAGGVR